MDQATLNIAGFNIRLIFKSSELNHLKHKFIKFVKEEFQGFLVIGVTKNPDFKIEVSYTKKIDTAFNIKDKKSYLHFYDQISSVKIRTFYHLSAYQFGFVIRHVLQNLLSIHNGFIIHASASNINGRACVFLGKSTAGKSTAVSLLKEKYPVLADDLGVLRKQGGSYYFYQIFSPDKYPIKKSPLGVKLSGIFFLKKSAFFKIKGIDSKEDILPEVLKQFFTQQEDLKAQAKVLMDFVNEFNNFNILYFAKNQMKLINLFSEFSNEKN